MARQLPPGGRTQLQGLFTTLGRGVRKVSGDGNCAFHSVGAQLGQPAAASSTYAVYKASGAAKLRADAHAFLRDQAPASWSAIYGPDEWETILEKAAKDTASPPGLAVLHCVLWL